MTFKNTNLWIIKFGLFIVPFIPLYISRVLFFPYITGKAFIFRVIVEIVFALWLLLAIFYKEYRPQITPLLVATSLFILIVGLAVVFGVNPMKSFWSNFERMEGYVAYLHLFAYFLVLSHVFRKKEWFIFLNLFIIAGLLESFYTLFQWLGYLASPQGGPRSDGTIGNPTYVAAYLMFIFAFCTLLWMNTKNILARYYYVFVGIFTLVAIYFTASRGPVLAILAGLIVASVLYLILKHALTSREIFLKKLTVVFLILLFLVPVGTWMFRDAEFVKSKPSLNRLTSISLSEHTAQSRFSIWNMSFNGFKERPILGWGPENYSVVFAKYFQPELWNHEPWFDRSHNIIFDWLINAGILGLLAYLSIFMTALYSLWRLYARKIFSVEAIILISALLFAYLLQNLLVFDNITTYICFFAVLAYINSSYIAGEESKLVSSGTAYNIKDAPIVAGILLIPLIFVIYFVNAKPLLANLNLLEALKIQNQDYQGAFEKYDSALLYDTLGNQEIREQFTRYAIAVGGSPQVSVEFKDKILRRAIEEAQRGVQENLLNPRPHLFLGAIYGRIGLLDEALGVFNKSLELSPKKQQIYFEIADIHIQRGDYKNAVLILEKAFNLAVDNDFARINLATAYALNGQQQEADKLIIEKYGAIYFPHSYLVDLYSRTKQYDRLINVWKSFVRENPNNIEYAMQLVGAYLSANQSNEAITALEDAIKLNPNFKAKGEVYIQQIIANQ